MNLSSLALSLIALSLGSAVLAGPLNIEMTNAKRLKMGLGPMAPRALYNPSAPRVHPRQVSVVVTP